MEHLTLKAVTTTTDQGVFEAVISTETSDREKDIVSAAAMVAALHKWNRPLPLAWAHSTEAEHIFGAIDTQSAKEVAGEVVVGGQVDMESRVGKEAWRSFKQRTIGFSFGYLILQAADIKGGGRNITELDVFEITATPTPMNNDTRVIFTKGMPEAKVTAEAWRLVLRDELELASKGRSSDEPKALLEPDAIIIPDAQTDEPTPEVKIATAAAEPPAEANIAPEAWKFILRDELERVPKSKPTAEPKALARFPDVQTEDDFKALSFHDKLAVYYAGLDDGAMDAEADEQPAKAAWAKAYATELPDSSFLYCGRFTEKDDKGNMATEDRRFFPVREPDGTLDVAHLRDALTRISLSSLPQKVKEKLTAETHQALKKISADTASAVEDGGKGQVPATKSPAPQDPLVREAWDLIVPRHTPGPQREPEPAPEPLDAAQVQREAWALALDTSGD